MVTELDLLAKMMDAWSKPGKQSPLMGFFKWDLEERSSIFLTSESCGQCEKWIIGEWDQQKEPWEREKKKEFRVPLISVAGSTQFFPWFDNWVDRFQLCKAHLNQVWRVWRVLTNGLLLLRDSYERLHVITDFALALHLWFLKDLSHCLVMEDFRAASLS